MERALKKYGPLAAAIHTTSDLQFFGGSRSRSTSNILDIPYCSKQVDHAIVIVGYGRENGKDYWCMSLNFHILEYSYCASFIFSGS